jgi:transcriptional/translational regulatory protein YebC/TACO1
MTVELDAEGAGKIFGLIDALEDSDDVQNVYANYDVSTRSCRGRLTRVVKA